MAAQSAASVVDVNAAVVETRTVPQGFTLARFLILAKVSKLMLKLMTAVFQMQQVVA